MLFYRRETVPTLNISASDVCKRIADNFFEEMYKNLELQLNNLIFSSLKELGAETKNLDFADDDFYAFSEEIKANIYYHLIDEITHWIEEKQVFINKI